ncbi:MAG TPA: hypothetical protein VF600_04080 [Abditibacteriaceae bacterium]|jgi:hypothetical protein
MNTPLRPLATLVATGALLAGTLQPASAQTANAETRVFVELRDASLFDALEMVYRAAGNPSHVIDPSAKAVNIGSVTFQNQQWNEIVLRLASQNNFRVRNEGGTYFVSPRPVPAMGGFPGGPPGGFPGGPPAGFGGPPGGFGGPPGGFGGQGRNPFGGIATFGNRSVSPSITTRVSPQTLPGRLGGLGGTVTGGEFRLLPLQHVYAGGIAFLFEGATVLSTQDFVIPQVAREDAIFGILEERSGTPEVTFEGTTGDSGNGGGGGNSGSGGGFGGGGSGGGFGGR